MRSTDLPEHAGLHRRALAALRGAFPPRGFSLADRWVCALILACFLWPGLVIFVEQTIISVTTLAQGLGISAAAAVLLGAYAIIGYPLLRSAAPRRRYIYAIALAIILPVCVRYVLTGVFLPGLPPSPGWLLRVAAAAGLLYAAARWLRRRHLSLVVVAFVVISGVISLRFYYHGDWIVDMFMFRQALWTTLHGQGFFYVSDEGGSHFGTHNSPLLFLLLPLYAVWSSGALLLLLQSAAVALSAYPMYGLARDRLAEAPAMVVTVGFLMLTPVIGPTLTMFKELPFALPLFLAALLAFERGRLKAFALWAAALLMVRETLAITVVLFALYAVVRRRAWPWAALPAAMGLAWGALSFLVILPHFFVPRQSNRPFLALYSGLGENTQQLAAYVVKHPGAAFHRLDTRENMVYLEKLTRPFGRFLPLGGIVTVFAAPDALMVGLSRKLGWPTHDVSANYHVIIAAALMVAFLYVVLGLKRRLRLSPAPVYLALGLFFITSLTDSLGLLWNPPRARMWPDSRVRARREIVEMIPPQASVSASYSMLMQLAHRHDIYPVIPMVKEAQQVVATDYVAMAEEAQNRTLMERLRSEGYRLVASRPSTRLGTAFTRRRRASPPPGAVLSLSKGRPPFVLYQKPGAPPLRGQPAATTPGPVPARR